MKSVVLHPPYYFKINDGGRTDLKTDAASLSDAQSLGLRLKSVN